MNVSPHTRITNAELLRRLTTLDSDLDPHINYRQRERTVRRMATTRRWYHQWRRTQYRRTQGDSGYHNACEWHWQHHACGLPFTEEWSREWDVDRRHRYRKWALAVPASPNGDPGSESPDRRGDSGLVCNVGPRSVDSQTRFITRIVSPRSSE